MLYTVDRHTNNSQIKSIGKYSINNSEQGNAADKATGESLDAKGKKEEALGNRSNLRFIMYYHTKTW